MHVLWYLSWFYPVNLNMTQRFTLWYFQSSHFLISSFVTWCQITYAADNWSLNNLPNIENFRSQEMLAAS